MKSIKRRGVRVICDVLGLDARNVVWVEMAHDVIRVCHYVDGRQRVDLIQIIEDDD